MTFSCNVVTMATYHLKEPWLPDDDILAVELLRVSWLVALVTLIYIIAVSYQHPTCQFVVCLHDSFDAMLLSNVTSLVRLQVV